MPSRQNKDSLRATTDGSHEILNACFGREEIIDLQAALRLANLDNPVIGLADELVQANLAELTAARALLFPSLNVGASIDWHQGSLMNSAGKILNVTRASLSYGAGTGARGAETIPIPGVQLVAHLGDAVFAPRVAEQKVTASRFDATATRHNTLLDVASAYLALVGAEARLLAFRQSDVELTELSQLTANFAAKGVGREADAQRVRSALMLLRAAAQRAEEDAVTWSTELNRLLSADALVRLRPEIGTPPLIQIVDPGLPLDALVDIAERQRPELAARGADIALNETRLRQERVRPFAPTLVVGVSAGGFGGGSDLVPTPFGHFGSRTDIDVLAVWNIMNLGAGNRALQNQVGAQIRQAEAERNRVLAQVRAEVADALATTNASRAKVEIAKRRLTTSLRAYRQDLLRTKNREGNLIEVLNSFNLLNAARQDLIQDMIEFSQSQFQLYTAIGNIPNAPPATDAGPAPRP